jgi:predicted DsbA family dithiol-disulfide isomerase
MKVEIWSDVMCPFCYIGKRKFEMALNQFEGRDKVQVVWKSFQLNPDLKTNPDKNINQYLAEIKGWTVEHAKQMNDHVTQIANEIGLIYNMDKALVANSFDAHRFSHLAKKHNLQNEAEEQLFKAYFTDGKNTADFETLIQLGVEIGLDAGEIKQMLESDDYCEAVRMDIYEAQQIGVSGVPFFLFIDKYTITGAQDSSVFLQALNTISKEIAETPTQ